MGPVFQAVVAVVGLVMSANAASQQASAQAEARGQQERANAEQSKARDEQKAAQAAQAAAERRQQLREERVKRAKLMQSGANQGTSMSSGESGAAGSLSTQLNSNIGFNLGQQQAGSNISDLNQNAADYLSSANNSISQANQWGNMSNLSLSIFDKVGGFNAFTPSTQAPAPVEIRNVG